MSNSADELRPESHETAADLVSADGSRPGTAAGAPAQDGDSRGFIPPGRLLAVLLLTTAISTIFSWKLVERFHKTFELPASVTTGLGSTLSPSQKAAIEVAIPARDIKNSSLTVGIFGAATGLLFGIAAGLARGSQAAMLAGILGGFLFGGFTGALGGAAEYCVANRFTSLGVLTAEHRAVFGHLTGWAIAGLGVGAGASGSTRCRRTIVRVMIAAFAGGLIGGTVYVPLVTILVPEVDTEQLIPDAPKAELIWVALPTIFMGLGMWRTLSARRAAKVVVAGHG